MAVERIDYQAGSITAKGALVWNEKVSGKRPLLLVMPNWLGVTDIAIKRAAKMAGDKYVAFVGDMYGDGKTSAGPPESGELMMAVRADRVEGRTRVNGGARHHGRGSRQARHWRLVEEGRGRLLLRRRQRAGARAHRRRSSTRSSVCTAICVTTMPAKRGDIKAAVFVIHGSKDPVAPKKDRDALEAELDASGANWQMLDFGDRLHSFARKKP